MKDIKSFLIIGGDMRQVYMAQYMNSLGYHARLYCFERLKGYECIKSFNSDISTAVVDTDAVILPLPVSRDGQAINALYAENTETLDALSESLIRGQIVFAGMMSNSWKSNFFKKGIPVYDYFEREELAVSNAVPTAQGVVKIAIENMVITLHGSECLIVGYGRTAKAIARALNGLGAHVTVAVRKYSDIAWAVADGYKGIPISEIAERAVSFDLIVNTVPTLIIDKEILVELNNACPIIDISSAPYGIDFNAAHELKLNVIVPGSLPGKTAPKTSGIIIADAILNIIKEGSK